MTISSTGHSRQNKMPVFLSLGFRPFFMLAALWALLAIALWTGMFLGHVNLPAALSPLDWHVHELLYGYLPAVIAGFLLTAVPNWTGRPPRKGMVLLSLVLVWIAGRAALLYALAMPQGFAATIDLLFLPFLMVILGSEIVAAKNWRNLPIIGVLGIFFLGNAIFHVEAILNGTASYGYGTRLGIAAAVLLVSLIGGRIVPNFTRNWLVKRPPGPMPTAFNSLDLSAMGISIVALAAWTAFPERQETGWLCLLAGILQMARLARWCGYRTLSEPLSVRGRRFSDGGNRHSCAGDHFTYRCTACVDRWRHRHHDARRHGAGEPGSYRAATPCDNAHHPHFLNDRACGRVAS